MRVELAQNYGFCFGVKRAIKITEEHQNSTTYGPLIHNSKEIDRLKREYNVSVTEDLAKFKPDDTAVIRTHGIPKNELKILKNSGVKIVDATCPYVTKPQDICEQMSKEGYSIVIFGDEMHPEIRGVKSYAKQGAVVINSIGDLDGIKLSEKIALVAQTTRKIEEYQKIVAYFIEKHREVRVFNTICNATLDNQDAVLKLAKHTDIMIIIGGKNSSNTKQLFNIAKEYCTDSYHIESQEDIDKSWFKEKQYCGISAGASTPEWIIQDIVRTIEKI